MTYNRRIRRAKAQDLAAIEARSFLPGEAATPETFQRRFKEYPQWFFVLEEEGCIAGLLDGAPSQAIRLTDPMFDGKELDPEGKTLMIFGLAAAPEARGRGVGSALLTFALEEARARGLERVSLTCKENLVVFYERFGFTRIGPSASRHGGAAWADMTCGLQGPITDREDMAP